MARFVCLTSPGSIAQRWRATSAVSASSETSGTILLTIPSSRARSTDNRSSPRRIISFAIFGPTSQGNSITTMPAPNFSSGSPKNAVSLAMVMSQARLSSNAPARHGPRTAAMVGFGQCQNRITASKSLRKIGFHWSKPVGRSSICSLRSKPEEKAWPAPATPTTRTAVSRSARSMAPLISWSMRPFSALVRAGRDSVRQATESATQYAIVSKSNCSSPSFPLLREQEATLSLIGHLSCASTRRRTMDDRPCRRHSAQQFKVVVGPLRPLPTSCRNRLSWVLRPSAPAQCQINMKALKLDVPATLLAADETLAQSRSLQQPRWLERQDWSASGGWKLKEHRRQGDAHQRRHHGACLLDGSQ